MTIVLYVGMSYVSHHIVRKMIQDFEFCTHLNTSTQVHLHGHSIDRNEIQLILEYMNLGGLDRLVKTGCKVPEKVVAGMMWQVFEALKYMKNVKNMMHRDIKPANILWCTNGRVKVGDFGISRKMSDDNQAHTFLGTHLYLSPERYDPPYSYPADVYVGRLSLDMSPTLEEYHSHHSYVK